MLFAMSDLHLSFSGEKPMCVFGGKWINHASSIKKNWMKTVGPNDTVIINGDISWAKKLEGAAADLSFISNLPGRKICMPGNHDYWWGSVSAMRGMYEIEFVKYDHVSYGDYAICAARGWLCPGDSVFDPKTDLKIYERELGRFDRTLSNAKKAGFKKIILATHYPPAGESFKHAGFFDVIRHYPVEKIIFGHLHGVNPRFKNNFIFKGIECILASCDYLNFTPLKIM